jgi:uncharacterized protein YajQ (UPF0234 family)
MPTQSHRAVDRVFEPTPLLQPIARRIAVPTFDVVSEVNMHEVANALDQAGKELTTRFDLKNTGSKCERTDNVINVTSDSDFHLDQVLQVLMGKLAKRGVDLRSLKKGETVTSGKEVRQAITILQGIDADLARKIVKHVKDAKMKVQASIQEQKVRVSGKKRDDLQAAIALLKEAGFEQPLQFENFRD